LFVVEVVRIELTLTITSYFLSSSSAPPHGSDSHHFELPPRAVR